MTFATSISSIQAGNSLSLRERAGVRENAFSNPTPTSLIDRSRSRAFSLIEVMVAVTLMSIIVLGLLAMFGQTQRAFRAGVTAVDTMESGRMACELMAREMEQITPSGLPNSLNFMAQWNYYALIQSLPGPDTLGNPQWRTNILDDLFFFTRENRNWQGIGYRVESTNLVGTLYRYETNLANIDFPGVVYYWERDQGSPTRKFRDEVFQNAQRSRIIDGVVQLRVLAYDSNGALITPNSAFLGPLGNVGSVGVSNRVSPSLVLSPDLNLEYHFRSNAVPAYLELELGILESKVAERARNLAPSLQAKFLESKAGNVQIFRQRIALRNVQPSVYQ